MDAEMKERLAEVYEKAADLIKEKGWRQGLDGMGISFCVGAALEEVGGKPLYYAAIEDLSECMEWGTPTRFQLIDWNDAPGRTQDEVVSVLRARALSLR